MCEVWAARSTVQERFGVSRSDQLPEGIPARPAAVESLRLRPRGEEERKKALAALQQGVGAQAGACLYENKVTTADENGNAVTKYYVGIYTDGPDAKGSAFEAINATTGSLGSIIRSPEVVTFGLVSNGTTLTNDSGRQVTIGSISDGRSPGATSHFNSGQLGAFILDPSTNPGQIPAGMMQPGSAPGSVDQGILALHELADSVNESVNRS